MSRSRRPRRRTLAAVLATLATAPIATAPGQPSAPADTAPWFVNSRRGGVVAGIAWSPISVSFANAAAQTERGLAIHFGFRLTPVAWFCGDDAGTLCRELSGLQVTPHIGYAATDLRGMNPDADAFAFSYVDALSVKVTYPLLARFRPTFIWRSGRRTAERFEGGDVVNYFGTGDSVGGGFEIPLTPQGRGIEISILRLTGRFDELETRNPATAEKVLAPANLSYRAVTFQIGWSGIFTGISLPWQ